MAARGLMIKEDFTPVIHALREQGLDPSRVVSCVPSAGLTGAIPGVRGCNVYDRCPFHLTRYGGFKGEGPKNVGYYIKVNDGTTHQAENEIACYRFVSLLLERMRAGLRDREQGRTGNPGPELINIVSQEGDSIRVKDWVKVNLNDVSLNAPYHFVRKIQTVSAYKHPDDLQGDSYESELERSAMERMHHDPDLQVGPPEMPEVTTRLTEDDDDVDWENQANEPIQGHPSPTVAKAEPVGKAKK